MLHSFYNDTTFWPLDESDESIDSRAVIVIASGSDGWTGGNAFGEIDHMCQWGANRNPCIGYRMAIDWAYPRPLTNPQTGHRKVPISNFSHPVGD